MEVDYAVVWQHHINEVILLHQAAVNKWYIVAIVYQLLLLHQGLQGCVLLKYSSEDRLLCRKGTSKDQESSYTDYQAGYPSLYSTITTGTRLNF